MAVNIKVVLKKALNKDKEEWILKIKLFMKEVFIKINFREKESISGKTTVNMMAIG